MREMASAAGETIRLNVQQPGSRAKNRQDGFRELGLDQPRVRRNLFSRHSTRRRPRFVRPDTPEAMLAEIRGLARKPLISVIVGASERLREQIESVRAQWYPYWELCLCGGGLEEYRGLDPRIKIGATAEMSTGEHLLFLEDGLMGPDYLLEVAKARGADILATKNRATRKVINYGL